MRRTRTRRRMNGRSVHRQAHSEPKFSTKSNQWDCQSFTPGHPRPPLIERPPPPPPPRLNSGLEGRRVVGRASKGGCFSIPKTHASVLDTYFLEGFWGGRQLRPNLVYIPIYYTCPIYALHIHFIYYTYDVCTVYTMYILYILYIPIMHNSL